jgi:hypothetical protein
MGGGGKAEKARRSPARVRLWVARASTVLLWTCVLHLAAYRELWAPGLLTRWPGCLTEHPSKAVAVAVAVADGGQREAVRTALPPKSKLLVCWFSVSEIFVDQASLLSLVRNFELSLLCQSLLNIFSPFLSGEKDFILNSPENRIITLNSLVFPAFMYVFDMLTCWGYFQSNSIMCSLCLVTNQFSMHFHEFINGLYQAYVD